MINDRFNRIQLLVGAAALQRLKESSVAVFGVGGVGSYAVEALVRGGVGQLTLVDFDNVNVSNINRQIHALEATIGRAKVAVMAERCRAINPLAQIVEKCIAYQHDTSIELLSSQFDYVLDCIDNIADKLHLIQSCHEKGIPIISSMGAANKVDPNLIQVDDISQTKKCRLARTIRKELRKHGIDQGIKVVYSTEEFRPLTGPDATERKPVLGSSSYLPPLFGLTMAGEVIRNMIGDHG